MISQLSPSGSKNAKEKDQSSDIDTLVTRCFLFCPFPMFSVTMPKKRVAVLSLFALKVSSHFCVGFDTAVNAYVQKCAYRTAEGNKIRPSPICIQQGPQNCIKCTIELPVAHLGQW